MMTLWWKGQQQQYSHVLLVTFCIMYHGCDSGCHGGGNMEDAMLIIALDKGNARLKQWRKLWKFMRTWGQPFSLVSCEYCDVLQRHHHCLHRFQHSVTAALQEDAIHDVKAFVYSIQCTTWMCKVAINPTSNDQFPCLKLLLTFNKRRVVIQMSDGIRSSALSSLNQP